MAKLKLRIPSLDEAPEGLRDYYREVEGGGYMIDHEADSDGFGIDNLGKLRGQLAEANRKKDSVAAKLLTKDDGSLYTREELEALQTQLNESTQLISTLKDKDKSAEEKFAERLRNELKPLQDKLTKAEQRTEGYRTKVHSAEADRVVDKIVKQLDPLPEWEPLLRSEIRRHVKVSEGDDGVLAHEIINPEDGTTRYTQLTGQDGVMGYEEFAQTKDLRDRYGKCLRGDGKEGAGPVGGNGKVDGNGGRGKPIVLPSNHTQSQFDAAWAEANKQGVELKIEGDG
jgi:flagellar hook-basal body complex protein FliE